MYPIKYTCPIIMFYRKVHSAVCPDDCHSQSISLRMKFWQTWPQFTEQVFRMVDHHWQHTTYLSQFVATLSAAAVCQRTTPGHNTCSSLDNCRSNVSANRQPLPIEALSSLCRCVLIGCSRSEDPVSWCHSHRPYCVTQLIWHTKAILASSRSVCFWKRNLT